MFCLCRSLVYVEIISNYIILKLCNFLVNIFSMQFKKVEKKIERRLHDLNFVVIVIKDC